MHLNINMLSVHTAKTLTHSSSCPINNPWMGTKPSALVRTECIDPVGVNSKQGDVMLKMRDSKNVELKHHHDSQLQHCDCSALRMDPCCCGYN